MHHLTSKQMAKKKQKKQQGQQFLSPEQYIKQKARTLEIGTCYVSNDIEEIGEGHVIVSRKHTGGRVSIAAYLVDIWCVGVKDTFYRLRLETKEQFSLRPVKVVLMRSSVRMPLSFS